MRPIRWLHISDIHLRASTAWSQDVVLTAMCKQIKEQRAQATPTDFILLTGDIAFSGKAQEYALAADFVNALCAASGVPKDRVFCIPGNHDIDRDRQLFCFRGARNILRDASHVDAFLEGGEDLKTLLQRQENYRRFQDDYFSGQIRIPTDDGMGYVARLTIEDVQLAIIGLDSAWLAHGGIDDHGKLLVGERQIISAAKIAQQGNEPIHIMIAMAHHPLHLLQEFDRRAAMNRIEETCHFLHCGHLHEPEVRTTGIRGTGCLTLSAGASFETRQSHNSYSTVTLDLLQATRTIQTFQYRPSSGSFSALPLLEYRIEVTPTDTCDVPELARAMSAYDSSLMDRSYYLASLILDRKAEFVVPIKNGYTLASFAVLQESSTQGLKEKTEAFLRFRNVLRVLYQHKPLAEILARHGDLVGDYDAALSRLCQGDTTLGDRLAAQERDAQALAATRPGTAFSHTSSLLTDLAEDQDWTHLRIQAERNMESPDPGLRTLAKRMMARSLASSGESQDNEAAIQLYRSIEGTEYADFTDLGNLSTLLAEYGSREEAKEVVLKGLKRFPSKREYFGAIGQRVIEATGDRGFRIQLGNAMAEREQYE